MAPRRLTFHFAIWTDPRDYLEPGELDAVADLLERAFDEATSFLGIQYDTQAKGRIPVLFRSSQGIVGFTTPYMTIVFHGYKNVLKSPFRGMAMVGEVAHIITGRHSDYMIRHLDVPFMEMKFAGPLAYPGCGFVLHEQAAALLEAGRLVPIEDIPADVFQWGFKPGLIETIADKRLAHQFYTESGSFGQYLMERYGIEALNRLRSRPNRAWVYAYGKPLEILQKEWMEVLEEARRQNPRVVKPLARAAQSADPCQASRLLWAQGVGR